jgi:hypothetical protein
MGSTVDQLRSELAEMRAAMDRQQARIEQLEAAAPEPPEAARRSRRQVLKLAGATLAGAAAGAAGIAGSIVPASAASGDPLLVGRSQDSLPDNISTDAATQLDYTGTTSVGAAFVAQVGNGFSPGAAAFPCALAGWSELAAMPNGVYGYTNAAGGKAVVAYNGDNSAAGGPGLWAQSRRGYAGHFVLQGAGKSHLYLQPTATAGAPAPAGHVNGELYVDSAGVLYYFSGGAFRPLAGGQGGLTTMLSAPIRLLESRPGFTDPSPGQTKPNQPIAAGDRWDIQITGQVMGGVSVPAGAKAVVGNVTVTNTAAGGYLTLWPTGAAQPGTSSINFGAAATVANGVIVGLSAAGKVSIYGSASTDVIFDASGYVL